MGIALGIRSLRISLRNVERVCSGVLTTVFLATIAGVKPTTAHATSQQSAKPNVVISGATPSVLAAAMGYQLMMAVPLVMRHAWSSATIVLLAGKWLILVVTNAVEGKMLYIVIKPVEVLVKGGMTVIRFV